MGENELLREGVTNGSLFASMWRRDRKRLSTISRDKVRYPITLQSSDISIISVGKPLDVVE